MSKKYTPGPWKAQPTYPLGDWCVHARGIPQQLAYLAASSQVDWPLEANARLIAAAPALVEALEAMRGWLGVVAEKIDLDPDETRVAINAVSPGGVREVAARTLRQIYEQADAALSQAYGEQERRISDLTLVGGETP